MDYEKEEDWLNLMSAEGLAFSKFVLGRYTFTECKPGEYIYRIELLNNLPRSSESKKYLNFLAESGVEHVYSWARWVYLRKKADDGPFDMYSDTESLLRHYRRINMLWLPLICLWVAVVISQFTLGLGHYLESGEWPIYSLIIVISYLLITLLFSSNWYKFRKKIKRLETEKQLRE